MCALAADGHTIGAHGLRHLDAPRVIADEGADGYLAREIAPCLDALAGLGLTARTFAYPNSRRDAASDAALTTVFDRLRSGIPRTDDATTAARHVVPAARIDSTRVLIGRGIDTARGGVTHPDDPDVGVLLQVAADAPGYVTLYAHDIAATSAAHHVRPERLRFLLELGSHLGLPFLGFDDLPPPLPPPGDHWLLTTEFGSQKPMITGRGRDRGEP